MRQLTASDALHVLEDATTWAPCLLITNRGETVRVTSHDRDLEVVLGSPDPLSLSGIYLATPAITATKVEGTAALAVDNLEVDALLAEYGLTQQDIRAGAYDDATFVLFLLNSRNPIDSGVILKRGVVGNIADFFTQMATVELRGVKQYLQQTIVESVGPTCRYELGDERCGVNLDAFAYVGEVTGVSIARRRIESLIVAVGSPPSPEPVGPWFRRGKVLWLTGSNAGLTSEVKEDHENGDLEFIEPLPFDIGVGDNFQPEVGCDHSHRVVAGVAYGDCGTKFDNILNFGGEDDVPNQNSLVEAADA